MWGTDGSGGVGLLSAAGSKLDVKFAYDTVFSPSNTNEQVWPGCINERSAATTVPRAAADLAEARAAAGPKWQTNSKTAKTCKIQLLC